MLKRALSLLLGLFLMGGQTAVPPAPDAQLRSFYYRYSGMMLPAFSGIDARWTEEGWQATFMLARVREEEETPVLLTDAEAAALCALMEEHALWKWAGFNEHDPTILDGAMFSFSATYSDGTRISAQGGNAFPEGYGDARNAILTLAESILIAHNVPYGFE